MTLVWTKMPVRSLLRLYLIAGLFLCTTTGYAEEGRENEIRDTNRFFALPVELDFDSGADNGDASILRIAPLYGSPSKTSWKFIHIDLITIADAPGGLPGQPGNPSPEPGNRVFGISDLLHASFRTAPTSGKWIFGIGGMISVPIASDSRLGSGKWSAGPAFRVAYRSGPWNIGAFGGQIWSFAGDDNRRDVSQFIVRGAIRRQLPNNWYFVSAPIITSNWKAVGEKWLLPVGGGIGKVFDVGRNPWAVSVQGYYNAIKPIAAPDWYVRLAVVAAIPLGDK
jgi:hypothetical protein